MLQFHSYADSNVGVVRKNNEDAWGMLPELNLFICCDGMGGHAAGEVASTLTVETIKNFILQNQDIIVRFCDETASEKPSKHDISKLLEMAVQEACTRVYEEAQTDDTKRGMGTTCDVLLITPEIGFIAHVGDSRVYLERQGKVHQLTEDHNLRNELIRRGKYTEETFDASPFSGHANALTRAVGVYESVEVELLEFSVIPGDSFLMCTDGMYHYLNEYRILQSLQNENPQDIIQEFIQTAREGGGHDNITGILVRIPITDASAESAIARAAEINLSIEVLQHIPIFQHLDYRERVRVHNICSLRSYAQDEIIFKEGEKGSEFFIILRGKVRVEQKGAVIATLQDRDHFGEMALVEPANKATRSASVYAMVPTRVLVIHRKDFFNILRNEHSIAVKLLWNFVEVLTERLRTTTRNLTSALTAEVIDVEIEEDEDETRH